ncbi:MAG: peptidylprolyl isomerase [Christensenellales bacterium]
MPNPVAVMDMENGDCIKIELYPAVAPQSVCNFIHLANQGFYNGLIFHRVIDGFMVQGGCPQGTGTGGPGYSIKGEFAANGFENDLKHTDGVISMARSAMPDSAGSQFFIMVAEAPHLDGSYAAFGKVICGMTSVYAMGKLKTDGRDRPLEPPVIASLRVDTFGVPYEEPTKL